MEPFWFLNGDAMPTLTLKNIPEDLHARLKASAQRNRRSLNSEILVRLEQDIRRPVLDPIEHAQTLRAFTARLPRVSHQRVTSYKRQGRP
jgi:plasmid stability protein